jgi:ribose transport system ATP-binding protein
MNDTTDPIPLLAARGLSKTFAGRRVLADVDLDVLPGEVHGLVGQNGSGKSTLIKILSGYHPPDRGGSLTLAGEPVPLPLRPDEPLRHGLVFVHQDLGLASTMTVLENLRVGRYETRAAWRIPWRNERRRVRAALAEFDLRISPDTKISQLREVDRAIVAILRALDQLQDTQRGVLILDEPTAYLPRDGVEHLLGAIRRVTQQGVGVVFVTHRLEEVTAVTDRVTVLRNGRRVGTADTRSLAKDELVPMILGRSLDELYPPAHTVTHEVAVVVDGLDGDGLRHPLSLKLRRGEILGLTGLVGMGWERALYLLAGAERPHAGTIEVAGRRSAAERLTPRRSLELGLALLPADRPRLGGAGTATVAENLTLPTLGEDFRRGLLRRRAEAERSRSLMNRFNVVPAKPELPFAKLSGGNQQKALLAKWFATRPDVLLLHEPTQGVDVGARRQLFEQIRDLAQSGSSILMASAEYGELSQLCDRVLVFRDGAVVAELVGTDLTEDRIVQQSLMERTSEVRAGAGG